MPCRCNFHTTAKTTAFGSLLICDPQDYMRRQRESRAVAEALPAFPRSVIAQKISEKHAVEIAAAVAVVQPALARAADELGQWTRALASALEVQCRMLLLRDDSDAPAHQRIMLGMFARFGPGQEGDLQIATRHAQNAELRFRTAAQRLAQRLPRLRHALAQRPAAPTEARAALMAANRARLLLARPYRFMEGRPEEQILRGVLRLATDHALPLKPPDLTNANQSPFWTVEGIDRSLREREKHGGCKVPELDPRGGVRMVWREYHVAAAEYRASSGLPINLGIRRPRASASTQGLHNAKYGSTYRLGRRHHAACTDYRLGHCLMFIILAPLLVYTRDNRAQNLSVPRIKFSPTLRQNQRWCPT